MPLRRGAPRAERFPLTHAGIAAPVVASPMRSLVARLASLLALAPSLAVAQQPSAPPPVPMATARLVIVASSRTPDAVRAVLNDVARDVAQRTRGAVQVEPRYAPTGEAEMLDRVRSAGFAGAVVLHEGVVTACPHALLLRSPMTMDVEGFERGVAAVTEAVNGSCREGLAPTAWFVGGPRRVLSVSGVQRSTRTSFARQTVTVTPVPVRVPTGLADYAPQLVSDAERATIGGGNGRALALASLADLAAVTAAMPTPEPEAQRNVLLLPAGHSVGLVVLSSLQLNALRQEPRAVVQDAFRAAGPRLAAALRAEAAAALSRLPTTLAPVTLTASERAAWRHWLASIEMRIAWRLPQLFATFAAATPAPAPTPGPRVTFVFANVPASVLNTNYRDQLAALRDRFDHCHRRVMEQAGPLVGVVVYRITLNEGMIGPGSVGQTPVASIGFDQRELTTCMSQVLTSVRLPRELGGLTFEQPVEFTLD